MGSVRKALAYSFFGANTVAAIQFASTLVIARLLTPHEIGIFSVAAVFVGIANLLRDFGVSNYLVQARELTEQTLRSALGLVILTSLTLGLLLLLSADQLALYFREAELAPVLRVLALNILLVPLGTITLTVARRQMRFRALAMINVISACAAVAVSVVLAFLGHGPISLAWGGVAGTLATALMSMKLRTAEIPWVPSLRRMSSIASFGIASGGANILGYINVTASDILLGRLLNMEAVALFNRSQSLTQFVSRAMSSAINPVLLPWLSEINRGDLHPRIAYVKVVERMTGVAWPIFMAVAVLNQEIILIMFGEQWTESAKLVPYICISASLGAAYGVCAALYNSVGKPSADLVAQMVNLPLKILAIVMLAPFGLLAIAQAWPWVAAVGALTHTLLLRRLTGISVWDTLHAVKRSFVVGMAAFIAAWCVAQFGAGRWHPAATLGIAGTAAALAALMAAAGVRHPLISELRKVLGFGLA